MARIHRIAGVVLWLVVCALVWTPENCPGLVIYRIGGEDLPLPPEAGSAGVEFEPLPWETTVSQGGEEFQVDLEGGNLELVSYDPNVNIATTWEQRGGHVNPASPAAFAAYDDDHSTSWIVPKYICAEFSKYFRCVDDYGGAGTIEHVFGGYVSGDLTVFPVDRVVIFTGRATPGTTVRNLRVHLGKGRLPISNMFVNPQSPYVEVRDNKQDSVVVAFDPPQQATFVQVAASEHNTQWEVQEIEVYARGYADRGTYVSNRIDLVQPAAWGDLTWTGSIDPEAQVLIRTRSGNTVEPTVFWRITGRGDQRVRVSRAEYDDLERGEEGGTTYDLDNWTSWSSPYDFAESAGTPVASLGPRRFLQFKVDFTGGGDAGGRVDFLEFRASTRPAASEVLGEITPIVADLGEATPFTYTLRPFIGARNTGFDHLELTASAARFLSVEAVRINQQEVAFTDTLEEHRLAVGFRPLDQQDTGIQVEVDFTAAVFRFGTEFDARVSSSAEPLEVPQLVSPGNATDEVVGDRVTVETTAERGALLAVTASQRTVTPNGDGINDDLELVYDIFETTHALGVDIEIRDLGGGLVRSYPGAGQVGRHAQTWDGRDASGRVVAPGVYLYRVVADADQEQGEQIGTICVAY